MSTSTKLVEKGKLKIENSNVICFLGKGDKYKSSEEIWKELKDKEITRMTDYYIYEDEKYLIYNPIPQKKISIIINNGKRYKSTVYFVDDIKNIIQGFKLNNPCFIFEGKNEAFESENDYALFLFEKDSNEIKDIENETIDYKELEDNYNQFKIKDSKILQDINKNIHLYSKIDNIGKEKYFNTSSRNSLIIKLNEFFISNKRDDINDVMYGILSNYASGKSLFLIYYNYTTKFPSLYLNLKVLKNAFRTKGFPNILNNELLILFKKLKKPYDDYKNFILSFFPYQNHKFSSLILLIIQKIKKEAAIIILDQYQKEIIIDEDFIKKIKNILFSEGSKIKVIISSSLNDGSIKEAYLNIFLNSIENKNEKERKKDKEEKNYKTNNYIPYYFFERLVDIREIKEKIKDIQKEDDKFFNDNLQKFNFLPLYYDLCKQNINNIENIIEKNKKRIEKKILKHNEKDKFELRFFDDIRKMIDNEITKHDLQFYNRYIPFKYFYIEKNNTKLILRAYFPLVKDIWDTIIMNKADDTFNGEIKYDQNVIGSLIELNLIINIKNKIIPLDIDSFVKVDTIYNFEEIIESDTDNYKNKNIFITQNNQNGPNYDLAYIKGKNINSPKLIFIRVKKSFTENNITEEDMKIYFKEKKKNFIKLFGFAPKSKDINLVYITLINNQIQQAISENKNVSDLGITINSMVNHINRLSYFCKIDGILLYYYEPKNHIFYIKNDNKFELSELDLLKEIKKELYFIFNVDYLLDNFKNNKKKIPTINSKYQNYLKNKRKRPLNCEIDGFDFEIIFKFAEIYFKNVKIINYIDLHESHVNCKYYDMSKNEAIICLKLNEKNEYEVCSFIYNESFIKVEKNNLKLQINNGLGRDNDFLVGISFDSINDQLKIILSNK